MWYDTNIRNVRERRKELMKYGIVYAYWSKDWEGDYIPAIKRAADCGFDVLEIFSPLLLTLPREKLEDIKAATQEYGVELSFLAGLGKEHNLASEDMAVRRNGIAYVKRILEIVHFLGGKNFSGINYCAWADFEGSDKKSERLKSSIGSIRELAGIAEDYDISYNLEITNRFENYLLNTSEEAVEFVREVGSPNVNILLDTFHMNIEEASMYDAIVGAGEKLGHFHVGENNRVVPYGGSMTAWDQVRRGLKEIGYDKTITLEPLVKMGGTVSRDSNIWRDLTNHASEERMDEMARAGLAYIKSLVEE